LRKIVIDGKTILKWVCEKWCGGIDWIDLVQDRERWRPLVIVELNFQVSYNAEIS